MFDLIANPIAISNSRYRSRQISWPGNLGNKDRDLVTDNIEISPWNADLSSVSKKKYKKPTWKFLMGTMPDLHRMIQHSEILLGIFGFFRSLGMWMGISNPFLGLCVLVASALDTWYNIVYMCWSVLLIIFWSLFLGVPKDLIYNGLYPVQGIFLGLVVYLSNTVEEQSDVILFQLLLLIPLQFLNLVVFQALCAFFVKVLNVTPMMISSCIVGYLYIWMKQKSTYFYSSPGIEQETPGRLHTWLCQNGTVLGYEILYGMSSLMFSHNYWSALPLSLGLLLTSPIMFLTTWVGSVGAVASAVIMSPVWSDVSLKIYALQGAITMSSVAGSFFVFNVYSFIVGVLAVFCTTFVAMGLSPLFDMVSNHSLAISSYFVSIALYLSAGTFENLIPVELISITVPEDHLRRLFLSRKIIKNLRLSQKYKTLDPAKFKNIENSLLPILLCSYAKHGNEAEMKLLLILGADPDLCDYDGRAPLHVAASENKRKIVKLLLKYNADVNKRDNVDNTALYSALQAGNFKVARFIYQKGGRLLNDPRQLASNLCHMARRNEYDKAQVWLECGLDPNLRDYDKRTPLHIAYSADNPLMIHLLRKFMASESITDKWGRVPSQCHADGNNGTSARFCLTILNKANEECALEFEAHDAADDDTDIESYRHTRTRFGITMRSYKINKEVIEAVILQMLRPETELYKMVLLPSLLCGMIYTRNHELLHYLISQNISFNVEDYVKRTPLHIAAHIGDLEAVKILVWHKCNVNAVDRYGYTPLRDAVENRHDTVCEHLRECGAKILMPEEDASTLLFWCIHHNDYDMLKRISDNGLDITVKDYDGRSCFDIAKETRNHNLKKILGRPSVSISHSQSSGGRQTNTNNHVKFCEDKLYNDVFIS